LIAHDNDNDKAASSNRKPPKPGSQACQPSQAGQSTSNATRTNSR
jgi:hypothetical protein